MDIKRLDKYVRKVIEKNGWYMNRCFERSDYWISEIEKNGYCSFESANQVISELGGLSFREYAPLTYQRLIESRKKEGREMPSNFAGDIKSSCTYSLKILKELGMEDSVEEYTGATFAFDALSAAMDDEIILDISVVKNVVQEQIFPIGTVEPDGISFVGVSGKIYTVFDDSIFLSGENIECYLNGMFLSSMKPRRLYHV